VTESYRVEIINVSKSFRAVHALTDVSFNVKPGEIHALVGENGAGKSTLMKVLSGVYRKDSGTIKVDGKPVEIRSPHEGRQLGIGIVYQELALIPDLTAAENIFIKRLSGGWGLIDWRDLNQRAGELLRGVGFDIDPRRKVSHLSVAYQQIVEISRELSENVRVLILDEPTSVLAPREVEQLFTALQKLKAQGVGLVYISHRLDEIFRIADRITVLKDGAVVGTVLPGEVTPDNLISMMIGRRLSTLFPRRDCRIGEEVLRVEGLSRGSRIGNVSFAVRAGEVLGIAGLVGSGRSEIVRAVFGAEMIQKGKIVMADRPLKIRSPRDAVQSGIALVPENRKEQGVILTMPIRKNITMPNIRQVTGVMGIVRERKERRLAQQFAEKLQIKARDVDQEVADLSGGNQQKVVLAKWLSTNCRVILLDEPTRGVDVGAKVEIYNLINELAASGLGIVLISSEMMEIIGLCDRVMVLREGRVAGMLEKPGITEVNIMRLAVQGAGNGTAVALQTN
jgi:ribose transport system ATP-binding protein